MNTYYENSWVLMNTQKVGTIAFCTLMKSPWHHTNEYSWGLQSSHEIYWALQKSFKCSWALMSNPKWAWLLLSDKLLDSKINEKCYLLKWLPCSILAISQSRFYQIIKDWIFFKSTRKGLLKHVQDEICRPLESQEIQKAKAERVLLDTL